METKLENCVSVEADVDTANLDSGAHPGRVECCSRPWSGGWAKAETHQKQIREIKALLSDPAAQVNDIAKRHGLSRTTLYKRVGVVQSIKVL